MPLITVFTPAYNRAYIIGKLYESLCRQTFRDFEWLVVDDGSTDDTGTLVAKFIAEKKFPIRYFRQGNGGKHRAINRGVREAAGTLFFIVDSDDFLPNDALFRVSVRFDEIRGNNEFAGVCGLKCFLNGKRVGGDCDWKILDCSCLEFRHRHKVRGDMAEVFRTSVMREFPFPEIVNERFCTEALVWNRGSKIQAALFLRENLHL